MLQVRTALRYIRYMAGPVTADFNWVNTVDFSLLQRPDLQNILRQSYNNAKLRSTYDGGLIYQTYYEKRKVFLRHDSLAIS